MTPFFTNGHANTGLQSRQGDGHAHDQGTPTLMGPHGHDVTETSDAEDGLLEQMDV